MHKTKSKNRMIAFIIIIAVVILIPFFLKNDFYLQFFVTAAISAISVIGFDLTSGVMGYTSFGHSAFMGMGAFSMAILVKNAGVNFWIALIISIIISGLTAWILSIPSFKLSGLYFSIGTMAFCQIFYLAAYNWTPVTGGSFGISGVPSPFSSLKQKYACVFIILFIIYLLVRRLLDSPIGSAMTSIKQNEKLAESIGVSTTRMKHFGFTLTGMIAGLAGALSTGLMGFANPASYTMNSTLEYLVIDTVGGAGSLIGPVAGAFVLKIFSQATAELQELRMAIYGMILIIVILFVPGGVYGMIKNALNKKKAGSGKEGV